MGLEDDLKARTSALISQQMATWVVEIQRAIQGHQASLVRALDDLGETVARYDEKVDERSIAAAIDEVLSRQPSTKSADYSSLKASITAIERGATLSEVLTNLVGEVAKTIDRAAIFIVKANAAVGWCARGVDRPDSIKALNIPLTADTVFRVVSSSRRATRGHVTHSPGTTQALARLGGAPQGILAVPLILRDKVAAILYCDTPRDEVAPGTADMVEIMVSYASKVIDLLSGGTRGTSTSATSPGTGPSMRSPAAAPSPVTPPSTPALGEPSASSTVMWGARPQSTPFRAAPTPSRLPAPPSHPPATPARGMATEDQKAHDDAKRFARLVVSEIKLYNEAKVTEGRRTKDIYERLKEDIERGRQMYYDRVAPGIRDSTDYFYDELVRILAGGDASALGAM